MNKLKIIGILILLCGIAIFLVLSNEISGITKAIIIGLMIGSSVLPCMAKLGKIS